MLLKLVCQSARNRKRCYITFSPLSSTLNAPHAIKKNIFKNIPDWTGEIQYNLYI